jgi:hypothetical protein
VLNGTVACFDTLGFIHVISAQMVGQLSSLQQQIKCEIGAELTTREAWA